MKTQSPRPTSKPPERPARPPSRAPRTYEVLDLLAGVRGSDRELTRRAGDSSTNPEIFVRDLLQRVRLIPWASWDRNAEGILFTIDTELREICEGRRVRPNLDGLSLAGFYKHLRAEIMRRRKEANDQYRARNWRPEEIHLRRQTELLDWLEDELGRIPG